MKMRSLRLRNQPVKLPVYMPDATLGVVRSVDAGDLEALPDPGGGDEHLPPDAAPGLDHHRFTGWAA